MFPSSRITEDFPRGKRMEENSGADEGAYVCAQKESRPLSHLWGGKCRCTLVTRFGGRGNGPHRFIHALRRIPAEKKPARGGEESRIIAHSTLSLHLHCR
jgi:hypothetical protein